MINILAQTVFHAVVIIIEYNIDSIFQVSTYYERTSNYVSQYISLYRYIVAAL